MTQAQAQVRVGDGECCGCASSGVHRVLDWCVGESSVDTETDPTGRRTIRSLGPMGKKRAFGASHFALLTPSFLDLASSVSLSVRPA